MDEHATALYEAVVAAVPGWVERSVERVVVATGGAFDGEMSGVAREAGRQAQAAVSTELSTLLETDIDEQRSTPLSILRAAVRYPTAVLTAAGVPAVRRDEAQRRLFPHDVYDLSPAVLGDVHPALTELGLTWGASKAHAHLQRHRTR